MSAFRRLETGDTDAAETIIANAYEFVSHIYLPGLQQQNVRTPEVIGVSGACVKMSEIVTQMAHKLGFAALSELHGEHMITAFVRPEDAPTEEDPIICTTWGQFEPRQFAQDPKPYFGARGGIAERLHPDDYRNAYSSGSILLKYACYVEAPDPFQEGATWVTLSPLASDAHEHPMGPVGLLEALRLGPTTLPIPYSAAADTRHLPMAA